ncbi:multidrug effflux MFS transporter [Sphingosinicella sp. LHD-64]|uniref:multidrug effflux MFS transporter n=1 Tax=Sphingosinicella sp. LHD-64 TaxID=3072139 RepID=UPI00280FCA97|nr:multidrug effflux MFS transporter [Sphingosinicella sp. LHD-64]MDQ8754849.1 multidrug effflux MFS transporter [Sphingosinicella sp. LHD-64]
MTDPRLAAAPAVLRPGFREFVVLMAGLMSLNALAIDAMVPALPAIGEALDVATDNQRQLVVSLYFLGFGTTQLLYGPLADRFGRKPVLLGSLLLYIGFALACAAAPSFTLLLAARLAQGAAAAATRVLVISIIRDRYEGAAMARLMSLVFLVFLLMPVLAPAFGQLTLMIAPWEWIFFGLAIFGAVMLVWSLIRLPETLHPEYRRPLSARVALEGARETLTNRMSIGYTLAFTLMMAPLVGYISSVQQIVFDVYQRPELIAATFAGVAAPMALASWLNARLVERAGTRRIAHLGLILFTALALVHLASALLVESLGLFILLQGLTMASFAFAASNMGALAMEPLGHVAGTASSVQGTITTVIGAALGMTIGLSFDGTTIPLILGAALCGAAALATVLVTERGRLFGRDPNLRGAEVSEVSAS